MRLIGMGLEFFAMFGVGRRAVQWFGSGTEITVVANFLGLLGVWWLAQMGITIIVAIFLRPWVVW
jgi:hypothetical protein